MTPPPACLAGGATLREHVAPPPAMLDAAEPPEILAGDAPARPSGDEVARSAISAAEALTLYRSTLGSDHAGERWAAQCQRVRDREGEARAALQWLGELLQGAGEPGLAESVRSMASGLVGDSDDVDMREVEGWERWLRSLAGTVEDEGGDRG